MRAQAVIAESAIAKVAAAGPDEIVRFVIRLADVLLPENEIKRLYSLGTVQFLPLAKQAFVALPGRRLLELAELPSVIQVL